MRQDSALFQFFRMFIGRLDHSYGGILIYETCKM
jgi:hypothetical protein